MCVTHPKALVVQTHDNQLSLQKASLVFLVVVKGVKRFALLQDQIELCVSCCSHHDGSRLHAFAPYVALEHPAN